MSATTPELMMKAKPSVDLPGFLASHGFRPTSNDSVHWRALCGPGGRRVLVHRASSGDWLWQDPQSGETGNIYHACVKLLGMESRTAMATIRRAVAAPPAVLPVQRGGGHIFPSGSGAGENRALTKPPRALLPLTQEAADYLTDNRCLSPATVSTFAHRLRAHSHGRWLVCPHHNDGDGEEYQPRIDGSTRKHFHGSRDDGPGRGRSLWHAYPAPRQVPQYLLVAESPIDAMSTWQMLDADMQARTEIVSTAGSLSEAGKRKLERLIGAIQPRCVQTFQQKLVLLDASDVGEASTQARTDKLELLAAYHGLEYRRWATPTGKDWNDAVVAEQRAVEQRNGQAEAETRIASDSALPAAGNAPQAERTGKPVKKHSGRR